jgi:hypothetical protein
MRDIWKLKIEAGNLMAAAGAAKTGGDR